MCTSSVRCWNHIPPDRMSIKVWKEHIGGKLWFPLQNRAVLSTPKQHPWAGSEHVLLWVFRPGLQGSQRDAGTLQGYTDSFLKGERCLSFPQHLYPGFTGEHNLASMTDAHKSSSRHLEGVLQEEHYHEVSLS